jgi:hypothetical protein
LAVCTPNAHRHFQLLLYKNSKFDYHTGNLLVVYADQFAKAEKLAEQELILN